ncbi:MAG: DUF4258 domain-containing protein [Nitrospinae bacterium]|nr:DUF4258 domain-containing protein [Nitrospinota bacterium]
MLYIEVISKLGKHIRTTKRHWDYITSKHESIIGMEKQIEETLKNPVYARLSKEDKEVYLYYAACGKYFMCVVCRHLNGDGFIITAYLTDNIKKGVAVYETN